MMLSIRFKLLGMLIVACTLVSAVAAAPQRLKWRKSTIEVGISESLFENRQTLPPKEVTLETIEKAFKAWEQVTNVTFRSTVSPQLNVDPPGPRGDGISLITNAPTYENQSLFPKGMDDAAARTRVFYDGNGGITEADIVLNPFLQFSVDGITGTFDLQATLTHELGHLLGLEHSDVIGSTMGESSAKNGIYDLFGYSPRTLSFSDIASVRTLYGSPSDKTDCCAKVGGRLTLASGKAAANWLVWLEHAETGQVIASARTGADGSFSIGGVEIGDVNMFTEPGATGKSGFEWIGEFSLTRGAIQRIDFQTGGRSPSFSLSYVGFHDQLARSAVTLNAGNVYTVLVAGKGLAPESLSINSSTPGIQIDRSTIHSVNLGTDVPAVSFDVKVSKDTAEGDYSLFITDQSGAGKAMIGSLTVEKYANIMSKSIWLD